MGIESNTSIYVTNDSIIQPPPYLYYPELHQLENLPTKQNFQEDEFNDFLKGDKYVWFR